MRQSGGCSAILVRYPKKPQAKGAKGCVLYRVARCGHLSDSVKRHLRGRHLRGRHLSVLNFKFDFISDGGCTREEQIALSLKRHLFLHGGREPKAFWICFSRVHPPSEIKSNFKFKTLKRHLLKRHLTLSEPARGCHLGRCFVPLAPTKVRRVQLIWSNAKGVQ